MSDLNFKYYTIYTHSITIHLSVWVSSGSFNVRFKNFALLLSIRLINVARNVFRRHSELLLRLKLKCWMFCVSVRKCLLFLRRELQPASYERQVVRWRKFCLLLNSFWELYCMSCFKNHRWLSARDRCFQHSIKLLLKGYGNLWYCEKPTSTFMDEFCINVSMIEI